MAYASPSTRSIVALVLSIVSWLFCIGLLSLPAFLLARSEIDAIERRMSPLRGLRYAKAAYWLAITNFVLTIGMAIILVATVVIPQMALRE
jgi:hypothetical protein